MVDGFDLNEHKHMSHYNCLKCEANLEKVGVEEFAKSPAEQEFFSHVVSRLGMEKRDEFPYCEHCNLVYPYVYHSPDIMRDLEPFSCASCGYFLEIVGAADIFPVTKKIFYCPDCMRKGLTECYYGFVEVPKSDSMLFLPLGRKQVKERFAFLESGEGAQVDLGYYSEAFEQDPDYVINKLGNQDCNSFILMLKYAYDYEPPVIETLFAGNVTKIKDEEPEIEVSFDSLIPPCPNSGLFEEFVVEPNCLYLRTLADKSKNIKNIVTFSFLFIVALGFMYSVKGEQMTGANIISDLAGMCAFVSLAILVMSLAVNYFNLFYYMELTCENGALIVNINDKVQSDHWQFNDIKSVCLAQYSKKKRSTLTVELDAPISTSKKSHSGIRTIGIYIYQHKKRYLIKLPFTHLQIKWIGIVIREVCKQQGILKTSAQNIDKSGEATSTKDLESVGLLDLESKTSPKDSAMQQLSGLVGVEKHK